jgi:DNA ligase (NAD+)
MTKLQQIESLRKERTSIITIIMCLNAPTISDYEFDMKLKELQVLETDILSFLILCRLHKE